MIDFSSVKEITIKDGKVVKITDASGTVLWSASTTAVVTITSICNGINGDTASITITSTEPFAPDPSNPNSKVTTWTAYAWELPNCTIELPIGSTIACIVRDTKTAEGRCYVMLNGTEVLADAGTYNYTVTGNVTVHVEDKYAMGEYGMITITEGG